MRNSITVSLQSKQKFSGEFHSSNFTLYQQNQADSELSLWGRRPPTPDFLVDHLNKLRRQKEAKTCLSPGRQYRSQKLAPIQV